MAGEGANPIFIVGSRFQSILADAIRQHYAFDRYDVLMFFQDLDAANRNDRALEFLLAGAEAVTRIDRSASLVSQFFRLVRAVRGRNRRVYLAAISNPLLMALVRLLPSVNLSTFDEGGYNISRDGPYFNPKIMSVRSFRGFLYRAIHPRGPIALAMRRSKLHHTPFDEELNLFKGRCKRITVDWGRYVDPNEAEKYSSARSILVLPCMKDLGDDERDRVVRLAQKGRFDLIARHPRDGQDYGLASICLSSPLESLVDSIREKGPVSIAHFNSTIGLTLADHPGLIVTNLRGG